MKKNIFFIFFLFFTLSTVNNIKAQSGLNFQGVARSSNNVTISSQPITIKLSILQGNPTGITEYSETRRVVTNAQGLFNVVIGDTGSISSTGNFATINWNKIPKFLKIEMDPSAGTNFITMGTTQFQYVAYAKIAESMEAENIKGILPVDHGGTGTNTLSTFKSMLLLDRVNNTTDLDKPISSSTQKVLDLKFNLSDTIKYVKKTFADSALNAKLDINDTIKYVKKAFTDSALNTKLNITDTIKYVKKTFADSALNTKLNSSDTIKYVKKSFVDSALNTKLNSSDTIKYVKKTFVDSALNTKLNTTDNAPTATKLATARKINGVDFDGSADITIDRLKAGDEFGGGIVFYTWANGKHGLIAAMDNLRINGIDEWNWSRFININTMAKSDGIGAGYKNMLLILARQGQEAGPYAASVCNEFKLDLGYQNIDPYNYGYNNPIISDWYLPSIHELKLIDDFALQYSGNDPNPNWIWNDLAGYWSSTEFDAANAFYSGVQCGNNGCIRTYSSITKTTLGHVRPIRMF